MNLSTPIIPVRETLVFRRLFALVAIMLPMAWFAALIIHGQLHPVYMGAGEGYLQHRISDSIYSFFTDWRCTTSFLLPLIPGCLLLLRPAMTPLTILSVAGIFMTLPWILITAAFTFN